MTRGLARSLLVTLMLLAVASPLWARSPGQEIGKRGRQLAAALADMEVERRWLPGDPVDWRTGAYDSTSIPLKSHCSAFVAAVCARFDVYILRPPEHPEWLLSNAQCDWLEREGAEHGWWRVDDPVIAQRLANRGHLVVAAYRSQDDDGAGHVAVVRPSTKSRAMIEAEGPDVIQAGIVNYEETSALNAFRFHPEAWSRAQIRYYSHLK
jgi:hypothetical protein